MNINVYKRGKRTLKTDAFLDMSYYTCVVEFYSDVEYIVRTLAISKAALIEAILGPQEHRSNSTRWFSKKSETCRKPPLEVYYKVTTLAAQMREAEKRGKLKIKELPLSAYNNTEL